MYDYELTPKITQIVSMSSEHVCDVEIMQMNESEKKTKKNEIYCRNEKKKETSNWWKNNNNEEANSGDTIKNFKHKIHMKRLIIILLVL